MYLGLGSNVGDRRTHLARALAALEGSVRIRALSRVYETEPVGLREQPDFWNLVVQARTRLEPAELLRVVKEVERAIGRTPTVAGGPRILDIDLLLYDDLELQTETMVIPHPRMRERAFVLEPLAEIAPGLRIPGDGRSADEILAAGGFERVRPLFPGRLLQSQGPDDA